MYLGKKKIKNLQRYNETREEIISTKSGAVFMAFSELDGLLNKTKLAEDYFERSQSWFAQKLHGATVCDSKREFTAEEYSKMAESFRDIAKRLLAHADEIDGAIMDD